MSNDSNVIPDKLCINCLHVGTNREGDTDKFKCHAPQNFKSRNLVDGSRTYHTPLCVEQRNYEAIECSRLGNWWTPVPDNYVKTAIGYVPDSRPLDARPELRAAAKTAAAGMDLSSGVDEATAAASKEAAAARLAALKAGKKPAASLADSLGGL